MGKKCIFHFNLQQWRITHITTELLTSFIDTTSTIPNRCGDVMKSPCYKPPSKNAILNTYKYLRYIICFAAWFTKQPTSQESLYGGPLYGPVRRLSKKCVLQ